MTGSKEQGATVREVIVGGDTTAHGALVGHVGLSEFPVGGPDSSGALSAGPNPYDLLSASLAACTVMTVRFQAKRHKFPLDRVEVGVSFHHGSGGKKHIFERTIVLRGDLDARQQAVLVEAANLCPVGEILGISADIRTRQAETVSGHVTTPQANYEDDLSELQIPNIDPD